MDAPLDGQKRPRIIPGRYFIEGYDLCNKDSRLETFGTGFDPSAVFINTKIERDETGRGSRKPTHNDNRTIRFSVSARLLRTSCFKPQLHTQSDVQSPNMDSEHARF